MNSLPKKLVDTIVTPSVLKMDKNSCENLLKAILDEKKREEYCKNVSS